MNRSGSEAEYRLLPLSEKEEAVPLFHCGLLLQMRLHQPPEAEVPLVGIGGCQEVGASGKEATKQPARCG